MQSNTSLPTDYYPLAADFPINDLTSHWQPEAVNAPAWQSGPLSVTGIADTSVSSLHSASVEYVHSGWSQLILIVFDSSGLPSTSATSQVTTDYSTTPVGALQTTGSQYHGTAGRVSYWAMHCPRTHDLILLQRIYRKPHSSAPSGARYILYL